MINAEIVSKTLDTISVHAAIATKGFFIASI
jgi:hypothetical protein